MRLELLPDSDGYSVEPSAADTIINKLPGGFSARRRDLENVTKIFTVQWTCDPYKFRYLWNFYREWLERTDWFDILLVDEINHEEYPLQNYKAMFLPNTVRTAIVNGWTRVFSCQLEAYLDNPYPMSTVYPIASNDDLSFTGQKAIDGHMYKYEYGEVVFTGQTVASGTLTNFEFPKILIPAEDVSFTGQKVIGGQITEYIFTKYSMPTEQLQISGMIVVYGTLREQLIKYKNYPTEEVQIIGQTVIGGTLT